MAKFKLLAGRHVISVEPLVKAQEGDVVESDRDLVALFGNTKFELLPEEKAPVVSQNAAPAKKPVKKDS